MRLGLMLRKDIYEFLEEREENSSILKNEVCWTSIFCWCNEVNEWTYKTKI